MLVMTCFQTVTYSALVNGTPHKHITPTRGIRQGDPLSLYLFLICAEGLSHMLSMAKEKKKITGLSITRGGTRISHLVFVDDTLLFCRANLEEWSNMHRILQAYEKASGQRLNMEKTSLFFGKNISNETRVYIQQVVGVNSTRSYEKYLGLPSLIGQFKIYSFKNIEGRIWDRLNGWKESFFYLKLEMRFL